MNWPEWTKWTIAGNRLDQWLLAAAILLLLAPVFRRLLFWLAGRAKTRFSGSTHLGTEVIARLSGRLKSIFIWSIAVYFSVHSAGLDLPVVLAKAVRFFVIFGVMVQMASFGFALVELAFTETYRKRIGMGAASESALGLILLCCKIFLIVLVFLTGLETIGIDVTTLIAGLGVGGIAVALAVQNVLGDLLASLAIMLDKPFEIGDFIVVGNYKGTIEKIGLKTTRIRSLSGEQLIYSNADLLRSQIQNYKRMHERRVEFVFGVTYGTSPEKLKRIPEVLKTLIESDRTLRFERAHLSNLNASSLDFETVYWVKDPDYTIYRDSHQELLAGLIQRLRELEIQFAFPTQTIFVERTAP